MPWHSSPYVYDRIDDDETEFEPMRPSQYDDEARGTVITDGVAMSYRNYRRQVSSE